MRRGQRGKRKRPAAIGLSESEKQVMALQRYFGERNREDKSNRRAQRIQSVGAPVSPLALSSSGVTALNFEKRGDPEGGEK